MKKTIILLALVFSSSFIFAQQVTEKITISIDVILGKRPPAPNEAQLMQAEEARNPQLVDAMHHLEAAKAMLEMRPNENYGPTRNQAINDVNQAWQSIRKTLYYRLWVDEHNQ
jgi:hypothetical protein